MYYSVYVGHLPAKATEEELKDLFSDYDDVRDAIVMRQDDNHTFGYGFVRFCTPQSVIDVVKIGGWILRGTLLHLEVASETREALRLIMKATRPSSKAIERDTFVRSRVKEACSLFNKNLDIINGDVLMDAGWLSLRMEEMPSRYAPRLAACATSSTLLSHLDLAHKLEQGFFTVGKPENRREEVMDRARALLLDIHSKVEKDIEEQREKLLQQLDKELEAKDVKASLGQEWETLKEELVKNIKFPKPLMQVMKSLGMNVRGVCFDEDTECDSGGTRVVNKAHVTSGNNYISVNRNNQAVSTNDGYTFQDKYSGKEQKHLKSTNVQKLSSVIETQNSPNGTRHGADGQIQCNSDEISHRMWEQLKSTHPYQPVKVIMEGEKQCISNSEMDQGALSFKAVLNGQDAISPQNMLPAHSDTVVLGASAFEGSHCSRPSTQHTCHLKEGQQSQARSSVELKAPGGPPYSPSSETSRNSQRSVQLSDIGGSFSNSPATLGQLRKSSLASTCDTFAKRSSRDYSDSYHPSHPNIPDPQSQAKSHRPLMQLICASENNHTQHRKGTLDMSHSKDVTENIYEKSAIDRYNSCSPSAQQLPGPVCSDLQHMTEGKTGEEKWLNLQQQKSEASMVGETLLPESKSLIDFSSSDDELMLLHFEEEKLPCVVPERGSAAFETENGNFVQNDESWKEFGEPSSKSLDNCLTKEEPAGVDLHTVRRKLNAETSVHQADLRESCRIHLIPESAENSDERETCTSAVRLLDSLKVAVGQTVSAAAQSIEWTRHSSPARTLSPRSTACSPGECSPTQQLSVCGRPTGRGRGVIHAALINSLQKPAVRDSSKVTVSLTSPQNHLVQDSIRVNTQECFDVKREGTVQLQIKGRGQTLQDLLRNSQSVAL